jgi:hypothetical protein
MWNLMVEVSCGKGRVGTLRLGQSLERALSAVPARKDHCYVTALQAGREA